MYSLIFFVKYPLVARDSKKKSNDRDKQRNN